MSKHVNKYRVNTESNTLTKRKTNKKQKREKEKKKKRKGVPLFSLF